MDSPIPIGGRRAVSERGYAAGLELATVAAIAMLALLIRMVNLSSLPMFNDEAVYLRWAADILDQRTLMSLFIPVAEDGKQPVFIWLSAAAMTFVSDPLVAGRIVSAIAGIASLVGIWLAGKWLVGRRMGLLLAFLYAVTPFTVLFDRMALADALVSTTAIWALTLGAFMAMRLRSSRTAILLGLALGGTIAFGVWVKPTALFALPIPLLCAVLLSDRLRPSRLSMLALVVAYVVFAAIASLLVVMPYAENQLVLLATHVYPPDQVSSSPRVSLWEAWGQLYWSFVEGYLPAPLYWFSLIGVVWGFAKRRRLTLLLLGSWVGIVAPSVAMANYFTSRYVVNSVFPMLFLAALPLDAGFLCLRQRLASSAVARFGPFIAVGAAVAAVAVVTLPSILFDARLVSDPAAAPWPEVDRWQYVEGWPAGYGFNEALDLAMSRARESNREVFILSDNIQGFPHDGLALYIRHMPRVRHFVEGEIAWGGKGVLEKWRTHNALMLIIRDDGRFRSDKTGQFEAGIPEAKPIGVFWKPGGQTSFRVYELDLQGTSR